MTEDGSRDGDVIQSLARRLEELRRALDPKERRILDTLLFAAADPVTRTGLRSEDGVFSADEEALIDSVLAARTDSEAGRG